MLVLIESLDGSTTLTEISCLRTTDPFFNQYKRVKVLHPITLTVYEKPSDAAAEALEKLRQRIADNATRGYCNHLFEYSNPICIFCGIDGRMVNAPKEIITKPEEPKIKKNGSETPYG